MNRTQALTYTHVNISLGPTSILKDVNLSVMQGEFIYITGAVGSGKTTLLRTIYADVPVIGKSACVLGIELVNIKQKNVPDLRRKMGIVFQDCKLLPEYNVLDNLRLVLKATEQNTTKTSDKRIEEVLELVSMGRNAYDMPNQLSGSQRQRVAIARAMLNNPSLLLADEPTGNLDTKSATEVIELLKKVAQNKLVVIVTHNIEQVEQYATRIIKMHDGRLIENREIKKVEEEPKAKESKYPKITFFNKYRLRYKKYIQYCLKVFLTICGIFLYFPSNINAICKL